MPGMNADDFKPGARRGTITAMMQSGFALVITGPEDPAALDGAVVELTVCGPGMLAADIRIPGHQADET
jgi:hypothetical protein